MPFALDPSGKIPRRPPYGGLLGMTRRGGGRALPCCTGFMAVLARVSGRFPPAFRSLLPALFLPDLRATGDPGGICSPARSIPPGSPSADSYLPVGMRPVPFGEISAARRTRRGCAAPRNDKARSAGHCRQVRGLWRCLNALCSPFLARFLSEKQAPGCTCSDAPSAPAQALNGWPAKSLRPGL